MKEQKRKIRIWRWVGYLFIFLFVSVISGTVLRSFKSPKERKPLNSADKEWSSRSYGFAPHPNDVNEPIIQVYAARTRGSKKVVAVHSWIATKRRGAATYIISQIFGWRLRRGGTALYRDPGVPDKAWARNEPTLILDLRGEEVEALIDKVEAAIKAYPWQNTYTAWPGPNSNTFLAWIGLQVPPQAMRCEHPSCWAISTSWKLS